jgi:hypothetical protein
MAATILRGPWQRNIRAKLLKKVLQRRAAFNNLREIID